MENERSSDIKDLAMALSKFQSQVTNSSKNAKGVYNNKYSDLAEVWNTIRTPLTSNNLSVFQSPFNEDDVVGVETILLHTSGQFMRRKFSCVPTKKDIQSLGGIISYIRRYTLTSILGIAQEDNDAQDHAPTTAKQVKERPTDLKDEIVSMLSNIENQGLIKKVNAKVTDASNNVTKLIDIRNKLKKVQ
jgi:hypothetical protein